MNRRQGVSRLSTVRSRLRSGWLSTRSLFKRGVRKKVIIALDKRMDEQLVGTDPTHSSLFFA